MLSVVVAAVVAFAVIVGLKGLATRVTPSGIKSNGRDLSRSEAREGIKEMVEMAREARAGDPSTLNMGFEPKTELGKNFKRLAQKSAGVEKAYADAMKGGTLDDLLAAPRLASQAERDKSRVQLKEIEAASATYFKKTRGVSDELFSLISSANGDRIPQAPKLEAQIDGNAKGMTKLIGIARKMIDFADEAKPTLQGSSAVFRTSAQVDRYNGIVREYNAAAQAFQEANARALRDRQQSMSDSIRKVDGGAL